MIVPMKKIHVIVLKKDIVPALEVLRDLGTVHVEHQEELSGYQLEERREEVAMLKQALAVLERFIRLRRRPPRCVYTNASGLDECAEDFCFGDVRREGKTSQEVCADNPDAFVQKHQGRCHGQSPWGSRGKTDVVVREVKDWTDIETDILDLSAKIEHHKENAVKWEAQIRQWQPWGDFDPKDIQDLAGRGIHVQLCEVAAGRENEVPPDVVLETVASASGTQKCLAISRKPVVLPFATFILPSLSLTRMQALVKEENAKIQKAEDKIAGYSCYFDALKGIVVERENVLRFDEVQKGMWEDQELAVLKGYCPAQACAEIREKVKQEHWGLSIEDPSDGDSPPTLLKNPAWIEWIKPVFAFMNILPGYREMDVSFFFLFFLSVFFGILIGDAGYGLMFIVLTLLAQWKLGSKVSNRAYFYLVYVLSAFAVLWGILTGTVFGTLLFKSVVKPMVPWLTNSSNVQFFCFTLGAIHLTIAHIWRAINRLNSVTAFAEVGWMAVIWASYFFINNLVLAKPLPSFLNVFLIGGPALVILFNQPRKNILAGIGLGLGDFLLSVMGFFGDVISYIRLFAVGLAGVAVADTTNQMALSLGFNHAVAGFFAALILIAGHLLNMVLSCFAILVHGIRLNILEFSMHLGVEWAGTQYEPFKKT